MKYIGKERPKVEIRNKELYQEDDRDYTDYSQIKEMPSWLTNNHSPNQNNNNQPVLPAKTRSSPEYDGKLESDYDNNFNNKFIDDNEDNTPPFPVNDEILRKGRKHSDTRFSILDNRDYSDVPPTPLTPKGQQLDVLIETVSNSEESDYEVFLRKRKLAVPKLETTMSLAPMEFSSSLLPIENKPLEPSTLLQVKNLLLNNSVKKLAQHFTKSDLDLCKVMNEVDLGLGVTSGLELVTLPFGKQLRQDIIER